MKSIQSSLAGLPAFKTRYGKYVVSLAPITVQSIETACKKRLEGENIDGVLQSSEACIRILSDVMQENTNTTKKAVLQSIQKKVNTFASNFSRRFTTLTYNPNGKYGYSAPSAARDAGLSPQSNTHIETIQRQQPNFTKRFESLL